jgi:hypothetical protein
MFRSSASSRSAIRAGRRIDRFGPDGHGRLGRTLIADPEWAKKAEEDRPEDIRQCIGCNQGCIDNLLTAFFADCLQNPEVGREAKYALKKTDTPKKILVIGGGIAGLETAVVAGSADTMSLFVKRVTPLADSGIWQPFSRKGAIPGSCFLACARTPGNGERDALSE